MVKRKILIISNSFYPTISPRSFRTTELVKEFSREGHEVVVYIPFRDFDYSEFSKENNILLKDLGKLKFKDITLKGNRLTMFLRRGIKRILGLLFEYPLIELMFKVSKKLKNENGYDLLISVATPYPIHWGVAKAWRKIDNIANCWIADCGDPYMGDKTDSFRKMFYFKYVEKWFSRRVDFLTVPFEGAISAYYPEFHQKIRIIPQGVKLDSLKLPGYNKISDNPVFAYCGGFILGKRDPRPLLDFLVKSEKEFKFIIYTSQPDILLPYKEVLHKKLEVRRYIEREELLRVLSGMDFLVNFDNNSDTQLPSKLIDYAIAGRPVINIVNGTDFSGFQEFLEGNFNKRMKLEPATSYDIKVVAEKFLSLLL